MSSCGHPSLKGRLGNEVFILGGHCPAINKNFYHYRRKGISYWGRLAASVSVCVCTTPGSSWTWNVHFWSCLAPSQPTRVRLLAPASPDTNLLPNSLLGGWGSWFHSIPQTRRKTQEHWAVLLSLAWGAHCQVGQGPIVWSFCPWE